MGGLSWRASEVVYNHDPLHHRAMKIKQHELVSQMCVLTSEERDTDL